MKKRPFLFPTLRHAQCTALSLILFLLASCAPKKAIPTPDLQIQIDQAVAATIIAMPVATQASPPTPYPTPTTVSLAGLYCEYQFCIGHPTGMAFYDHLATINLSDPSTYIKGFLYSYQIPNMIISLIWLQAPGTSDPKFLLDTILDDQADTQTGNLDVKLIRNMNVIYTPITTTISEVPFGSAGAWTCGDRVFAWKVYTTQADTAAQLFEEALARFICVQ
jgi:hypothetical protein